VLAAWPSSAGEDEYALTIGASGGTRILVLPALFDEANKLRHFTVAVMRQLERAGIASVLPDLPGCNESRAPLEYQSIETWREAATDAASFFGVTHVLTLRGGALVAPFRLPVLRYAPATGSSILRAMVRARMISSKEAGIEENREALLELGRHQGLELAGYRLGPRMIRELETAEPADGAALTNIAQGDLGGAGLWLRAEPDHDPSQADAFAALVVAELLA
jgi:hypothetical protein